MTDVRIIYNPYENKTTLIYEKHVITSAENKIYSYLLSDGFYEVLLPFKKRYSIWYGLLPELIKEVNDDELKIIFEGRLSDYELIKKAFEECREIVENEGYANAWSLDFEKNFESENVINQLLSAANMLRDVCETRAELREVDKFKSAVSDDEISELYGRLMSMIKKHIEKWEVSSDDYRQNRINELNVIIGVIENVPDEIKLLKKEETV